MSRTLGVRWQTAMRVTLLLEGCALSAALVAATPQSSIPELGEVQVTAKVPWPIEDYVEFPRFDSVVLSPDGKHLAIGWGEENFQRRLTVVDWPSMDPVSSELLQIHMGISDLRWLDNSRLLVQPDWPSPGLWRVRSHLGTLMFRDMDGRELQQLHPTMIGTANAFEELRVVEALAKLTPLTPGKEAFGPLRVVATRPDELLFQTMWTDLERTREPSLGVFRLDMTTWQQTRIAALPLRAGRVFAGAAGRVSLVAGVNAADEPVVYYLPEGAGAAARDWQLRIRGDSGGRGLLPVAWAGRDEEYYALDGRDRPTREVVLWNARDNSERLLYSHPEVDMDAAWRDPAGRPWMFSGTGQVPVYWYPDPAHPLARLHHAMVQRLPNEQVDIVSATDDMATAVARVSAGNRPSLLLIMDVAKMSSRTGMQTYPKLRGRRLSPVEPIAFHARDGLEIRGYLTTPLDPDGKPQRGSPLLVIAHDGPRDGMVDYRYTASGQYEFERQLFASRGYAVLQVNVRGTGGRGAAFEQAGDGRWGLAVQDDYADAVRWAIDSGAAAAGHACFYGTGFGAYSAMIAAARAPELFQCVIGVGGLYDLPLMMKPDPDAVQSGMPRAVMQELLLCCAVMNPRTRKRDMISQDLLKETNRALELVWSQDWEDKEIPPRLQRAFGNSLEELQARSPVTHAESIAASVLLIDQYLDVEAPGAQFRAMRDALKAAGNSPRTGRIGDEEGGQWEGYFTLQGRVAVYKNLLAFLERQIGPQAKAPARPANGRR